MTHGIDADTDPDSDPERRRNRSDPMDAATSVQIPRGRPGQTFSTSRAFLSDPPHHPHQVVISLPDGESHTFTKANAPDLIGQPVTGPVVGWKVTSMGVLPLLEGELKDSDEGQPN